MLLTLFPLFPPLPMKRRTFLHRSAALSAAGLLPVAALAAPRASLPAGNQLQLAPPQTGIYVRPLERLQLSGATGPGRIRVYDGLGRLYHDLHNSKAG